jgi:hypothetical protein
MSGKQKASEIRDYVEKELARTIRNHPDPKVVHGGRWEGASGVRKGDLIWTIEGPPDPWQVDYAIEARVEDEELLIWFGYSSAGALQTRHLMRPAVHLSIQDLAFATTQYGRTADVFSLGAILELMLRCRDRNADLRFPMNNCALT